MQKQFFTTYNPYFLVPLAVWYICGGFLFLLYTPQQLFSIVNTHYTAIGDVVMYYITWLGEGLTITFTLLALLVIKKFRNWWYLLAALLCVGLPALICQFIKQWHNLPRPYNYFHKASWIHISPYWGDVLMNNSFPSGHTTGAFSIFCFLSMLLPGKYRVYGLLFFLLALSVGYSRIYLAAHFFTDVYAGSILGAVTSLIMFALLKRYQPKVIANNDSNHNSE